MNAFAAALLLASALGGARAKAFPHSGDACKDTCEMTRMGCEADCQKAAKQGGDLTACRRSCADEVASCRQICPAALKRGRKQLQDQGLPEPQPQTR